MKGWPRHAGTPVRRSALKQKEEKTVNWDEAPALHTYDRKRWYDKNKLAQDHTTTTEGYYSTETGGWIDVGGESGNKYPNKSSLIDMTKTTSGHEAALWHMNLKTQETPIEESQAIKEELYEDVVLPVRQKSLIKKAKKTEE